MKKFEIHDLHHLRAAEGWLELGSHLEADAELDNIAPELRSHPNVLEIRWHIYAKARKWDACLEIARAVTQAEPNLAGGWIHLAYAARRAKGGTVQAAWDLLHPVAERFPKEAIIPYNLACYACQLGNSEEAKQWLEKALSVGDSARLKMMALNEPDLEPIWRK